MTSLNALNQLVAVGLEMLGSDSSMLFQLVDGTW